MPDALQDYFPSAKVRLIVRLGSADKQAVGPVPKNINTVRGANPNRAGLSVQADPTAPPGTRRLLIGAPSGASSNPTAATPQQRTQSVDGLTFELGAIIPKEATWSQNGIRTADQLTVLVRYIDFPIDPRVIRSAAVEFYLGTVTADAFARGVAGEVRQAGRSGGRSNQAEPLNVVPDDTPSRTDGNRRFIGFVDNWEVEWSDDGEALIKLDCRDNTQLFIDTEVSSSVGLDKSKPIDQAIADYLANYPAFAGMSVEYRPGDSKPPKLVDVLRDTSFTPDGIFTPKKTGGAAEKLSIWDYLTDVAGALGHNIRVEDATVVIQQPVTIFAGQDQTQESRRRADDTFTGRTVDGKQFEFRRFIYGRNILSYKVVRNFARHQPKNIEVRSYNSQRKTELVARFPEVADRAKFALPGAGADEKWTTVRITSPVRDTAHLKVIAQNYYQAVGRNEVRAQIATKNLASFGGGNEDPDLLDMRVGDTVQIFQNASDEFDSSNAWEKALVAQGSYWRLTELGFTPEFANAYLAALANVNFQTIFKVRAVTTRWTVDEGVSFDIQTINFIEVEADAPVTPPEKK